MVIDYDNCLIYGNIISKCWLQVYDNKGRSQSKNPIIAGRNEHSLDKWFNKALPSEIIVCKLKNKPRFQFRKFRFQSRTLFPWVIFGNYPILKNLFFLLHCYMLFIMLTVCHNVTMVNKLGSYSLKSHGASFQGTSVRRLLI